MDPLFKFNLINETKKIVLRESKEIHYIRQILDHKLFSELRNFPKQSRA